MSGYQPEYYLIKPFNKSLAQEGWHIDADAKGALGSYIRNHTDQLITISRNTKLAEPPKFQVTQRVNSWYNYSWPMSVFFKDLQPGQI